MQNKIFRKYNLNVKLYNSLIGSVYIRIYLSRQYFFLYIFIQITVDTEIAYEKWNPRFQFILEVYFVFTLLLQKFSLNVTEKKCGLSKNPQVYQQLCSEYFDVMGD